MIHIIINHLTSGDGKLQIGGVQSYIDTLATLCTTIQSDVLVYEFGNSPISVEKKYQIIHNGFNNVNEIIKYIDEHNHDYEKDLLIFATDFLICKNHFKHSLAIQHGVAWDITKQETATDIQNYIAIVKNAFRAAKKYKRYKLCSNLVCVDYNFVNWYRTQVAHVNEHLYIIPNFTLVPDEFNDRSKDNISIVFARRFFPYRGTRLFTEVAIELLRKYPNISITIAGSGPDEKWMRDHLDSEARVTFTSFTATESLLFHSQHDIAVVPTTGSEGTSLSLLEAMAAGCAVVCSNVGGMTNVILDGYNGRIVNPEKNEFVMALSELIEGDSRRREIAKKGYETVKASFSLSKWEDSWLRVIKEISSN